MCKDIKVGDIVHVRGRVTKAAHHESPFVIFNDASTESNGLWIHTSTIVHVEPRQFKVGDRVRLRHIGDGTIIGIHGPFAWIKLKSDDVGTYTLNSLERV